MIYIITQMKIDSQIFNTTTNSLDTKMSVVVRQVEAESKEEAIGKYVIDTKSITAIKKLDIECYELKSLIKIS